MVVVVTTIAAGAGAGASVGVGGQVEAGVAARHRDLAQVLGSLRARPENAFRPLLLPFI